MTNFYIRGRTIVVVVVYVSSSSNVQVMDGNHSTNISFGRDQTTSTRDL